MSNEILETLSIRGQFTLALYVDGKYKGGYADSNLVVELGKSNVTKLLGGDAAGLKIEKICVGTNGLIAALGDNAITEPFIKNIDSVSYPESNSVMFSFSLDGPEANGMTIREFGLLNSGNILFARKVRSEIVKTDAIRLVGTWKITIN